MKAIILVIVLVIIFIGVTILNIKTKVPEGIELPEKCNGCNMVNCKYHNNVLTQEVVEEIKNNLNCKEEDDER